MNAKLVIAALITGFIATSFTLKPLDQNKPWPVPEAAKNKKNPVKSDAKLLPPARPCGVNIVNHAMVPRD